MDKEEAEVTRAGIFDMQVCVPDSWNDVQIELFANDEVATGISSNWEIRKEGHEALNGQPEKVQCQDRRGFVHVVLEC